MIPLSLTLAAVSVLSIWTVSATGCGDRQEEVDGRCCNQCPPGTYMKVYCSERKQTICSPCAEGYFSDHYSMFDRCEKCRSCQQDYAEKCTLTTNANCSCGSGFLCSNNACSKCEENKCIAGQELKKTANPSGVGLIEYSYQCEPLCPDNTYFDEKEDICKSPRESQRDARDSIHVILGIGFVLLSLSLLVCLSYACIKNLRKHKAYNNPIEVLAVSTNTSDYHLSKEESGRELIVQDESKNGSFSLLHLEKVATC